MSEIIKKSDVSEKDIYGYIIESAKIAEKQVKELNDELIKSAKIQKDSLKNNKFQNSADVKKGSEAIKEANRLKAESNRLDKISGLTKKQMQSAEQALQKQREKGIATMKKEADAYNQLSKKAREAKNESKRLGAEMLALANAGRKGSKEYRELSNQYRNTTQQAGVLDKQLKHLDSRVGDNFRNVGNYGNAVNKLRGLMGQLGLAMGIGTVVRSSFNIIKDFDQGVANLASVLGKTRDEVVLLEQDAKRLGATTKFTASEVAGLQTEYAKLGFSQQEILNATEATLSLAGATGTDLARSAEVSGATLRGFGLDASEMNRVVDVMAKSFSASALDTEKFAESMKYVAPIAKVAGLSIEETTAMLGALANAGISGSNAGTALRQVISQLDKTGKTTGEALKDLATKGLNLADAEDEVGKNAKTALLVLADQTTQIDKLNTELINADGSAKKMADTQLNTLGGAMDLLKSAFEGYILGVSDSTGANKGFQKSINFLADNLGTILSVLGKLLVVYSIFIVRQKVLNSGILEYAKNMMSSTKATTENSLASEKASAGASKFKDSLKSIGWSVAIGLGAKLVGILIDVANGSELARVKLESYNRAVTQGQESAKKMTELLTEVNKKRVIELNDLFKKKQLTKEQYEAELKLVENGQYSKKYRDNFFNVLHEQRRATVERKKQLEDELKLVNETTSPIRYGQLTGEIGLYRAEIAKIDERLRALNGISKNYNQTKIDLVTQTNLNTEATGKEIKSVEKLIKTYDEWEKNRKVLSNESTVNKVDFADVEATDEAIKNRRRLVAEINVLTAEQIGDEEELKNARIKQIEELRDIELENVELTEVEILKIKEQANKDIIDLENEYSNNLAQKEQERLKKNFETVKEFVDLTTDYFIQQSEKRIEQLDKEIAKSESNYSMLEELAKNGNISAQQSLKEEQKIINEANKQKIKEQRRIERLKLAETTFGIYQGKIEAGDKTPLLSTIKDVSLLKAFIASLPAFKDGIENTGANGRGLDGKGGFLSILHPNERVMTSEQNSDIGDLSNKELSNVALKYNSGQLVDLKNRDIAGNSYDLLPLLKEIKGLKSVIENRPTHNIELGEITRSAIQIVQSKQKGNKLVKNKFNIRK